LKFIALHIDWDERVLFLFHYDPKNSFVKCRNLEDAGNLFKEDAFLLEYLPDQYNVSSILKIQRYRREYSRQKLKNNNKRLILCAPHQAQARTDEYQGKPINRVCLFTNGVKKRSRIFSESAFRVAGAHTFTTDQLFDICKTPL
jgi:hypothetical protein